MSISLEELEHDARAAIRQLDVLEEQRDELTDQADKVCANIQSIKFDIEANQERIDEIRGTPYSREEREELQEANREARSERQELYEQLKEIKFRRADVHHSLREIRHQLAMLRKRAFLCLQEVRANKRKAEEAVRMSSGRSDVVRLLTEVTNLEAQAKRVLDLFGRTNRVWSGLETGTIDGTYEVDFKTSNDGHTLIADHEVNRGDEYTFDRQRIDPSNRFSKTIPGTGLHNHYGPGDGDNNNGVDRGFYTGPFASDSAES